ncbi:MAG: hypothetical protein CMD26_04595 [Flavobacteriales bacterium]|nr:hypothetical protein [Flavobacteriales bacterium]|tara:strand:+ start:12484 stop:13140 length:657 start_codon:yes stop_codon:yes gene_type:complete
MIKDIIKRDLSAPKLNDSAINTLAVMEEHKISHVPVVDENNKFIGLIDELSIINMSNIQNPLNSIKKTMKNIFLLENAHVFQSIQTLTSHLLSIIPIVNENNTYLGYIEQIDIIQKLGLSQTNYDNLNIIVIALHKKDYILSEISRLIEENNGKIITLWQEIIEDKINVHLALNCINCDTIIKTLERYEYNITQTFSSDYNSNALDDRFESFINYLNT